MTLIRDIEQEIDILFTVVRLRRQMRRQIRRVLAALGRKSGGVRSAAEARR